MGAVKAHHPARKTSHGRGYGLAAQVWTGEVFRVMLALQRDRPDLRQLWVNTEPTELLLITGFGNQQRMTADAVESIIARYLQQAPQVVPDQVLERPERGGGPRLAIVERTEVNPGHTAAATPPVLVSAAITGSRGAAPRSDGTAVVGWTLHVFGGQRWCALPSELSWCQRSSSSVAVRRRLRLRPNELAALPGPTA